MIRDLLTDCSFTLLDGRLVNDLATLTRGRVRVVPTAVLPADAFRDWRETGRVNDLDVEQVLQWAGANSISESRLRIRPSTAIEYVGLLQDVSAMPNFAEVHSAIDRIYRSWGAERSRASRLINEISEEEGSPSLLLQPQATKAYTILTRHAVKGTLTNSSDFDENVNNRIPQYSIELEGLIRTCDSLLRRPVQIDFAADEECNQARVIGVRDQEITDEGLARVLSELDDRNAIEPLALLMAITPNMIGVARIGTDFAHCAKGLPASPGVAQGQLIFRGVELLNSNSGPLVLCIDELHPDKDLDLLEKCSAAFALHGGMTSHFAVASRGMGKPAVTMCGGKLDLRKRVYQTDGGARIPEFTTAIIDGAAGSVAFSESALTVQWVASSRSAELRDKIVSSCSRLSPSEFKRLPVKTQLHIASLKSRLRDLGMLND